MSTGDNRSKTQWERIRDDETVYVQLDPQSKRQKTAKERQGVTKQKTESHM